MLTETLKGSPNITISEFTPGPRASSRGNHLPALVGLDLTLGQTEADNMTTCVIRLCNVASGNSGMAHESLPHNGQYTDSILLRGGSHPQGPLTAMT